MFMFVLCAFFAVAAAEPGVLLTSQLAPLPSYISPGTTTITKTTTGYINQDPLAYSSWGFSHNIKKRGAPWSYLAPSTYISNPGLTTYTSSLPTYKTGLWQTAGVPIANTHYIKKRSAQVLGTSYIDPITYTSPLLSSTLTANAPWLASSYVSQPFAYGTHLIKKRSAPEISAYTAPGAITYGSWNLHGTPISTYGAPWAYSSNIPAYSHYI